MMIDIDHLPCGCLITTPDREILSVNQYFSAYLGWRPDALVGRNMNKVLDRATHLFCESYVVPMVFREERCSEILIWLTSPEGATYPSVANVQTMPDGNFAWVFLEAESRDKLFKELEAARFAIQEQHEKLEVLARSDELTGLANRRELESAARRVFLDAERLGIAVSVLILDIDSFKSVNDTYGHDAGDRVICALADAMKATCRESDTVARMGGDEFVCVLNNCGSSDAGVLCERIHEAVARTSVDAIQFTVSIGLAVKPHDTQMAFPDVLKLADQCLYKVKENGRNASRIVTAHSV